MNDNDNACCDQDAEGSGGDVDLIVVGAGSAGFSVFLLGGVGSTGAAPTGPIAGSFSFPGSAEGSA